MVNEADDVGSQPGPSSSVLRGDAAGGLSRADKSGENPGPAACAAHAALRSFIEHPDYPCVGAKASLTLGSYAMGLYPPLTDTASAAKAADDIRWFGANTSEIGESYVSFLAVFQGTDVRSPEHFEGALWAYLQAMHRHDSAMWDWDPAVSDDPRDPDFRYSIGGAAFFVIGLHPHARREARRFPFSMLVFNLHSQFEELRAAGQFERLRDTIRQRETELEGEPNPLLKDFGSNSEAAQYAGCPHARGWTPPFRSEGRNEDPTQKRKEQDG